MIGRPHALRLDAVREHTSLLQKVRRLFLAFSLLGLPVLLVFSEGEAATGPHESLAIVVIGATLVRLAFRRRPDLLTDALLGAALMVIAVLHDGRTLDLLFSAAFLIVNSRALYGSRRNVLGAALFYAAVLNLHAFWPGAVVASVAEAIIPTIGTLLPAWLMSTLANVLRRHEESAGHERVLQGVGHDLLAEATREEIYARALRALDDLASHGTEAFTGVWTRTEARLHLVLGPGRPRQHDAVHEVALDRLPSDIRNALEAGQAVHLDSTGTAQVLRHLDRHGAKVETIVVPVMQRSELCAVLVVVQPQVPMALADAVQRLAVTVALALDRSDAETLLAGVMDSASDTIAVIEPGGRFLLVTPAVERTFGFPEQQLHGARLNVLLDEQDAEAVIAAGAAADEHGKRLECRARHADGGWRSTEITVNRLTRSDLAAGLVLGIRDVTQRKSLEAEIEFRAFHDPLTGFANRVLFADRVHQALERTARSHQSLAVVFLDIDDFKTVNDSLGHLAGDELLTVVADRIRRNLRDTDTAARMGGDEFALLLEDVPGDESAIDVLSRILTALREPCMLGEREMVVTASAGLRLVDAADGTVDELLRDADLAMYQAKVRGKDCLEIFEPSMHVTAVERLELRADLQVALEREQFTLVYQPVVSLPDARPVGVEALLRWQHPERGTIPPNEFIATAEELGVLLPVGRWVIGEVCRQLRRWDEDAPGQPLTTAVNLSQRQLHDPLLCETVRTALRTNGLAPHRLVLEITEETVMIDRAASAAVLGRLRELGVRLAVDDFGDGYSSLGYLRTLPIDILKIDKSFIDATREDSKGAVLTQVILTLAERLGLTAIAEGIEHREQADDLAAWGCPQGQGFLFARPLDPDDLVPYLLRHDQAPTLIT